MKPVHGKMISSRKLSCVAAILLGDGIGPDRSRTKIYRVLPGFATGFMISYNWQWVW